MPTKLWANKGSFPLGIACGDVSSNSVVIWGCYTGQNGLKLALWIQGETGAVWQDVQVWSGGYILEEIEGLLPFQRYCYAFYEADCFGRFQVSSAIGYFKTAPAAEQLVSLKFGAVSCVKHTHEPVILEHAGARKDLDFFLHNGDNSYNDGCHLLTEFRASWRKTLRQKGCQELRRSTSMIPTLDDHEIQDNFDPETVSYAKLVNGRQAFFEHMPMRRNRQDVDRIWRQLSWGRTLDIFVLDCRTERSLSRKEYLSRAQMDWLKKGLLDSQAMFKVIMNSVPISEYPMFPMSSDRWEGYPEQREEILGHINRHGVRNLLWVSGDFHFSSLGRVGVGERIGYNHTEVLAGPGAQLPNVAGYSLKGSSRVDWVHVKNSYITVTCDVNREQMQVEVVY